MKILVCIKQVPDTNEVKIDQKTGTLIRDGVPSIINHDDKNALEEVLKIKDSMEDVHITVLSMGPPQAEVALREALAMGADRAILVSGREFGGSDTWATAHTLAAGIRKAGQFDLYFCGRQAIDGDTAQVGPQIAEYLDLPQVTYVRKMEIKGNTVRVERALEDGYEVIELQMPCLLTAIKELNEPRYPSIGGIFNAYKKEIEVFGFNDLEITQDETGLKASPTNVKRSFTPAPKGKGIMIEGNGVEAMKQVVETLLTKHII